MRRHRSAFLSAAFAALSAVTSATRCVTHSASAGRAGTAGGRRDSGSDREDRMMLWHLSWRADPRARPLADRHYNRQKPGAAQFVPPGGCLVLLTTEADA